MERIKSMKLKKRLVAEITILLIATAALSFGLNLLRVHMSAPAAAGQAAFYSDAACTQLISDPWDWGQHGVTGLTEGATINVWLKNTGSTSLQVNVTVLNPTCIISVTPSLFTLTVGQVQAITLTFTGIVAGSSITWDLNADY